MGRPVDGVSEDPDPSLALTGCSWGYSGCHR